MIAVGWRTFDDLVEAHRAIFSGDPTSMASGSSQIRAWKLKNRIPKWMELTMTLAHAITTIDRDGLEKIARQKGFMKGQCQYLFANPDAEFDALFAKEDLTKDEGLRFAHLALQKLDALKWQKRIHINSEGVPRAEYLYRTQFIPKLADDFSAGARSLDDVKAEIARRPDSASFITFHLAEKLATGDASAGKKLDELIEFVDLPKISDLLRCSELPPPVVDWLSAHGCETTRLDRWPITALGMLPLRAPPLTVAPDSVDVHQPTGGPQDPRLDSLKGAPKMKGFQNPEPRRPQQTEPPRAQGKWQLGTNLGKAPDPNAPSVWERQRQNRHQQNRRPQRPPPEVEPGDYHVPSYHKVAPKPEPPKFDENIKAIAPPVSAGKGVEGQTQFKISPALLAQKK